jgi:dodecin
MRSPLFYCLSNCLPSLVVACESSGSGPFVVLLRVRFEEAINEAVSRATKTLRGVEGCWVKEMNVLIEDGNIVGYKVNVAITFVLEDGSS